MTSVPEVEITTKIKVPFFDVDSMHIVWHGHYVKYLEVARCELLDSINYGYLEMAHSGYLWPVVDMRLKYVAPARFGQWIQVFCKLTEFETRLKLNYEIIDIDTGKRLTKAHTIQVAVASETQEMQFETPAILKQRLGISCER